MMSSSRKEGDAIIELLLAKGADSNIKNNASQTALHFAASKANLEVARQLITHMATTRTKDRRGQVPLHRAAAIGSVPMMKLLLENRSPLNGADIDMMTPLHHACSEGHGDAAVLLLKEGAESDKRDGEGKLAIDTTPDAKVRKFILDSAEREGISVTLA
jgi:26S proteasome non-ATPase regulatory subunit 10